MVCGSMDIVKLLEIENVEFLHIPRRKTKCVGDLPDGQDFAYCLETSMPTVMPGIVVHGQISP